MSVTALIDYGSGNLRSAEKALQKAASTLCGHAVVTTSDPDAIAKADRIVLPGVGAFAACMGALQARDGVIEAMTEAALSRGAPFLGVCVGMQLLATRGLEFGETAGLGWIAGDVKRLESTEATIKVPHMGWNDIRLETPSALLGSALLGEAAAPQYYFTHSFAFYPADAKTVTASVENGERFPASVEQDNMAGVQFHPEKSQAEGLAFISRFLEWRP
jgi:glutamine amidotransferase